MTHFSVDAKSCYDGTCKNSFKYYGPQDEIVDGSKLTENPKCAGYYFKLQRESVRKILDLNHYNVKLSSVWGHCSIYSPRYFENNLGFRYPADTMKTDAEILQVGLNDCYKNQNDNKWCRDCSGNNFKYYKFLNHFKIIFL